MKLIFATLALLICWQNTAHSKVELDSSLKQIEEDANPIASQKLNVLFTFEKQAVIADQLTLSQMMAVTQVLIEAFKVEYPGLAKRRIKGFPLLNGFSVSLSPAEIEKVLKMKGLSGVHWLDEKVTIALPRGESSQIASRKYPYAWGVEKIGVKTLQETYPEIDGSGVRIGVLDTGIKPTHRDLEDKILHFKNFSLDHNDEPADEYDHGTHIAGTLVGEAHSGRVIGVAPGAKLVVARIFDRSGQSTKERILEAMHWMLDPDEDGETDDSVHIVNASWGTRSSYEERSPEDVPYCQIVKIWAEMNIIAVFAAGNNGPAEASIGLPGGCPHAISVGASEHSDRLMYFSAVGPAKWKDLTLKKPELVAPGFKIYSASSNGRYKEQLGTSMAAPHVSGTFALLRQAYPDRSSEELVSAVLETAKDLGDEGFDIDFGYGRIQGEEAFEALNPAGVDGSRSQKIEK